MKIVNCDVAVLEDKSILMLFDNYCILYPNTEKGWKKSSSKFYLSRKKAISVFYYIEKFINEERSVINVRQRKGMD